MSRVLALVVRLTLASRVRFILLSTLVAVGMVVFLLVTELSRVSGDGLDDAIDADIGRTGTYIVSVESDLGLGHGGLTAAVQQGLARFTAEPIQFVEHLGTVQSDCPPLEQLGQVPLLILRDEVGRPDETLPFGRDLPFDSDLCLDGVLIPNSEVHVGTATEQSVYGAGLFLRARYADIARLATTQRIGYRYVVVTGEVTDKRDEIEAAVLSAVEPAALRNGVEAVQQVVVSRTDAGQDIRRASEGVRFVYALISWGILLLGGIGLLVAELVTIRERLWLIGLARAVGARTLDIVALVLGDVGLVLLAGTALAVSVTAVMEPFAGSFAQTAFEVEANLLRTNSLITLALGQLALLFIAGGWPAVRAAREDPLSVLEAS